MGTKKKQVVDSDSEDDEDMEEENDEDVDEEPMEEDDGETEPTKTRGGKSPEPIETVEEEGGRRNRKGGWRPARKSNNHQSPPGKGRRQPRSRRTLRMTFRRNDQPDEPGEDSEMEKVNSSK